MEKTISNIEIGWVVEILKADYTIAPGYSPIRKIVYSNKDGKGIDLVNKYNKRNIIYPVVDFNNMRQLEKVENKEYVIMPYGDVTVYMSAFHINTGNISKYKMGRVKSLLFQYASMVEEPIFLPKNINIAEYRRQVNTLHDYKCCYSSTVPTLEEKKYLDNIYVKTL